LLDKARIAQVNHEARPHVLSHDPKDSMAQTCPGPFCNFVPPNHPLLINNWVDRISFREFDSGRAEFGCGLHHRHDFNCSTGAAGFYPIPSGGPTRHPATVFLITR
jgi:hypothetical protein